MPACHSDQRLPTRQSVLLEETAPRRSKENSFGLHRQGPITNSSERTIWTVKNGDSAAIRLGPVAWHNDRHFISHWKLPVAPIAVLVFRGSNQNTFKAVSLKYLHGMFEDASLVAACEDEIL